MKIVKVEAIPVNIPRINPLILSFGKLDTITYIIVKIYTDEGIIGLGEATTLQGPTWSEESQETIKGVIDKYLAKLVIGEDPFRIEKILEKMDYVRGNLFAKAAIEFALFDILGKYLEVPVYQLLGGLYRRKTLLSWSLGALDQTPEMEAKEGLERIEQGWKILKMKVAAKSLKEKPNCFSATGKQATGSIPSQCGKYAS